MVGWCETWGHLMTHALSHTSVRWNTIRVSGAIGGGILTLFHSGPTAYASYALPSAGIRWVPSLWGTLRNLPSRLDEPGPCQITTGSGTSRSILCSICSSWFLAWIWLAGCYLSWQFWMWLQLWHFQPEPWGQQHLSVEWRVSLPSQLGINVTYNSYSRLSGGVHLQDWWVSSVQQLLCIQKKIPWYIHQLPWAIYGHILPWCNIKFTSNSPTQCEDPGSQQCQQCWLVLPAVHREWFRHHRRPVCADPSLRLCLGPQDPPKDPPSDSRQHRQQQGAFSDTVLFRSVQDIAMIVMMSIMIHYDITWYILISHLD